MKWVRSAMALIVTRLYPTSVIKIQATFIVADLWGLPPPFPQVRR
jgi:hypothetical protein